jgi:hypothetical protein
MASYRILESIIVPTGAMSGTSTIYSQSFDVRHLQSCSFQPEWTGTPTGVLSVWVSNDGIVFDDLVASVTTQPAGSADHTYIPIYAFCAAFIRLQYVNASGTGVLGGRFLGKTR